MSTKIAKAHFRRRYPEDGKLSMKEWCRTVHIGCKPCQDFAGSHTELAQLENLAISMETLARQLDTDTDTREQVEYYIHGWRRSMAILKEVVLVQAAGADAANLTARFVAAYGQIAMSIPKLPPISAFKYSDFGQAPATYRCDTCPATNVKLWRGYNNSGGSTKQILRCVTCALANQRHAFGIRINEPYAPEDLEDSDQIGGLMPAVPIPNSEMFWAYSLVPTAGAQWWYSLPSAHPVCSRTAKQWSTSALGVES